MRVISKYLQKFICIVIDWQTFEFSSIAKYSFVELSLSESLTLGSMK